MKKIISVVVNEISSSALSSEEKGRLILECSRNENLTLSIHTLCSNKNSNIDVEILKAMIPPLQTTNLGYLLTTILSLVI